MKSRRTLRNISRRLMSRLLNFLPLAQVLQWQETKLFYDLSVVHSFGVGMSIRNLGSHWEISYNVIAFLVHSVTNGKI